MGTGGALDENMAAVRRAFETAWRGDFGALHEVLSRTTSCSEEEWELADVVSLLRQLGALPQMAQA